MVRHTRKQRAGKFIGQGVYGCGFTPSLRCKGESTRRNGLSKMMIDKHAVDEEFEISARIARIDPERKYFLTATGTCEHDQTNINRSVKNSNSGKKESCSKFPLRNKSYLIFYEMGGQNLETLKVPVNKYPAFFRGLENLFKGLVVLHKGNIVHADIKPDNIVGKLDPDGTYNIRYIDFGVSVPNTNTLNNQSDIVHRTSEHTFRNYPPHYPIDSIKYTKGMKLTREYLINWYSSRNKKYPYDSRGIIYHDLYPQKTYWNYVWRIPANLDDIIGIVNQHNEFYTRNTKQAMESLDIYGLGFALSMVYSRLTGHYSRLDSHNENRIAIKFKNNETYIEDLPESDVKSWHKKLADEFSIPFYNLISQMMILLSSGRPNAERALRKYQEILVNVDSCFQGSDEVMYSIMKIFGADVEKSSVVKTAIPAVPAAPAIPAVPAVPAYPAVPVYPTYPTYPALPAVPAYPAVPAVPAYPAKNPLIPPQKPLATPLPYIYKKPARFEVNRILNNIVQKPVPFIPFRNRVIQYPKNNKTATQKYLNTRNNKSATQKYLNTRNNKSATQKYLNAKTKKNAVQKYLNPLGL